MQRRDKPLEVGITGGIGAGKTLVCQIFAALGLPVYNADSRAKWITNNNKSVVKRIKNYFGEQAYLPSGELNRAYVAGKVFNQKEKLDWLNNQVHPEVKKDYDEWVTKQNSPYTIKEAALLFESGSYKQLDFVITVNASEAVRLKRVLQRDSNRSAQQVKDIFSKQLTDEERATLADYVITNDGHTQIVPKVLHLHHEFLYKQTQLNA